MKKISIYVHIPFCVQKCAYCDFLSAPAGEEAKKAYADALCMQMQSWQTAMGEYEADTVFFGGGTPSCLPNGLLEKILCKLKETFHCPGHAEITVEVNPGTVDINKLKSYFDSGVSRLSIGLQSPFEEDLRTLGRIHAYSDFMSTYEWARSVGFTNINVDLMSALPGQGVERYIDGLRKVSLLEPEHISAYSLIVEEGTPFYGRYKNHPELLPGEETEREMYEQTRQVLGEYGYRRYEISNYAKAGYECRHNIVYWRGRDYLGLGLGAASKLSDVRFRGTDSLEEYMTVWGEKREDMFSGKQISLHNIISNGANLQDVRCNMSEARNTGLHNSDSLKKTLEKTGAYQEIQILSETEQMEEFMFLGLRCMDGISETEFQKKFHRTLLEEYGTQLCRMEQLGLMERTGNINGKLCKQDRGWRLTGRGIDVSNAVFVEFLH